MTRLVLLIILFLVSLLTVFKAPAYYLWLMAIGVTEFPWLFISIAVALLATGYWVQKYQLAGTLFGLAALLLLATPIVRAYLVASSLKTNFDTVFMPRMDSKNDNKAPFSFFRMFAGAETLKYQTLTYVKYADTAMSLDFYPSQVKGSQPCVIVVHGGSWAGGDSQQVPELNSYMARKGYNVASINYRLAPKYQSPAPVEDIKNCMAYLRQHAGELNIDTNNFVLLGRSAGAQIALLAAYTLHNKSIKAVIDFYGPADMVWGYSIPSNPLIMDSRKVMSQYLGGTYQQVPQNFAASSPLEFVDKQSIPTLIIHGENDVLVAYEHSRRLNEKLQQNGIKHFWLQLPWATHGFDFNLNGPGGQLSTYTVERFLKAVCPPAP
ncbi:MAG: alpha/beta hydrolase fold domain-containing protein [Mucilaginibacter sp.]